MTPISSLSVRAHPSAAPAGFLMRVGRANAEELMLLRRCDRSGKRAALGSIKVGCRADRL
jgi:hypothetical protein